MRILRHFPLLLSISGNILLCLAWFDVAISLDYSHQSYEYIKADRDGTMNILKKYMMGATESEVRMLGESMAIDGALYKKKEEEDEIFIEPIIFKIHNGKVIQMRYQW
ncbi:MAG: immunity protein 58 [Candidatus Schekmanbacteria bacterium]|nr:immunity protein 58 [Candidatus Schekmanbacteria bacterium]